MPVFEIFGSYSGSFPLGEIEAENEDAAYDKAEELFGSKTIQVSLTDMDLDEEIYFDDIEVSEA